MTMMDNRSRWAAVQQLASEALAEIDAQSLPRYVTVISTAAELHDACTNGGNYDLVAGDYVGNFVIRRKIVLTGPGVLKPADPLEPTLRIPDGNGSGSYIGGLTILSGAPDRECFVIGNIDATDASQQPSAIVIQHCVIRAGEQGGHRGIALHGSNLTVMDTRVEGFWEKGRDSQAIWIHNGPGPYLIDGCYLEASGENILLGGDSVKIPNCVPSDVVIRSCQLLKPIAWKTNGASVKNSFEVKNGRRVTFENNVIDGWWPGGQAAPIQLTPRNQNGDCPWAVVDDITIQGNVVKNAAGGFAVNILGTDNEYPSQQTRQITIRGNLFQDSTAGIQVLGGVEGDFVIDHNTFPAIKSKLFSFDRLPGPNVLTRLWFTNNVCLSGTYGVTGDGSTAIGLDSLLAFCELVAWSGNLIGGSGSLKWPQGQAVLTSTALLAQLDPVTCKLLTGTAGY